MKKYLLGFDLGTLSSKALLADFEGNIIAEASKEHSIIREHQGWAEHDPEATWWGEFKTIVQEMLYKSGIDAKEIAGIGICGLVPTMCPVGDDGIATRNAILYLDNRAISQLERVNQVLNQQITMEQVLPKLLWFKEHELEKYKATRAILNPHSYLVFKLTGQISCDVDTANVFGGIFKAETNSWDEDLCIKLGINPDILPKAYPATAIVGEVTLEAAKLTGLAQGTPVIAGTGDSFTSLLGNGVTKPGEMMLYFGTAGTQIMCNRDLADLADTIHISHKGQAVEFRANVLACGQALQWFKEEISLECLDFSDLDRKAEKIPCGSEKLITLPHLMGRRTPIANPLAKGVVFGLTPNHTRYHMYRSLLESVAYGFREGFDEIRDRVKRIVVAGGGAKSFIWRQITSEVLNHPVEYPSKGGTSLGIAYLVGYSLGIYKDFEAIRETWSPIQEIHYPDKEHVKRYNNIYKVYLKLGVNIENIYQDLHQIS